MAYLPQCRSRGFSAMTQRAGSLRKALSSLLKDLLPVLRGHLFIFGPGQRGKLCETARPDKGPAQPTSMAEGGHQVIGTAGGLVCLYVALRRTASFTCVLPHRGLGNDNHCLLLLCWPSTEDACSPRDG